MINMIPTDPKRPQFLTLIDNRSDLILDSKGPSRKVVIKFKAQMASRIQILDDCFIHIGN